jgi:hypothetical protein
MSLTILGRPAARCACRICRAERLRIWRALTPRRLDALRQLAHGPRTPIDLLHTGGVQPNSWRAIAPHPTDTARPFLIATIQLRQWTNEPGRHFLTLTDLGREVLAAGQRYEKALG